MKKTIVYLDMDGTIADLYGTKNWLPRLRNEESGVFIELEPFITETTLLALFPESQYDIRILSMTPKQASKEYCEQVIIEKNQWLDIHFPSLTKRIYKPYSHNKNLKNSQKAILIDDNLEIRKTWKGISINPKVYWNC